MAVLADRYELGGPLGSGGMARVVAAYDRLLQREVAIKLIHDAYAGDPVSRERMLREARAAAGLHHPNTVMVFDVGEVDGQPFIVMERINGRSLAHLLHEDGWLPVEWTTTIADAVLTSLQMAHERGLVHRDVKPSNILLPDAGGVKLADFGIAKALSESTSGLTGTDRVLGSPRYLAPEQAAGQSASPAGDLYSLGVVIYECLAGHPPFRAESPLALMMAHHSERVPPLAELVPHVPPALARVVECALAKSPAERYPDARTMRSALHQAVSTPAPPPPPPGADAPPFGSTPWPSSTPPLPGSTPLGAEGTRVLEPAGDGSGPAGAAPAAAAPYGSAGGRRSGRVWLVLAAVVGIAVLAASALLILDGVRGGAAADGPTPGPSESTTGGTVVAELDGLDALITELAIDSSEAGERGEELFHELRAIRNEQDRTVRVEESRSLIETVSHWITEYEIDPEVGRQAVETLADESLPDTPELHEASALSVEVAASPLDWGEEADDLLSALHDLLGTSSTFQRADQAHRLVEDLEGWIAERQIDVTLGQEALTVLRPLRNSS
ncbi:serine/threonine-protein kinase [Phytoactinopolyspora endophytica]|uniref:serine/threonine-protein kinase n=1 Tax=Phytoactinopolyspora endophytica TaxID=1642495 RepID=UPI00101C978E|nr:serine/threonine-protein kinase [Phytoactinopolyspora endophytica]